MADSDGSTLREDKQLPEQRQLNTLAEVTEEPVSEGVLTSEDDSPPALGFPVVGLGTSAGGLEAFKRVLQNVPANTGMAFVLVQHLSPQHISNLSSLLTRVTAMPVIDVENGTPLRPNYVFVIPPNKLMSVSGGVLELSPRPQTASVPMSIDYFFRSLARDQKDAAIGVVLAGTDSDGVLGLQTIREAGGLAVAQSEESAKFAGMPHNAAGAGPVDLILTPEEIGRQLGKIGQQGSLTKIRSVDLEQAEEGAFNKVLSLLRKETGIDFHDYKHGTLRRRIARRMLLQQLAELGAYSDQLETDGSELVALYEDLLINVTSFFRDPDVFQALEQRILPELLKNKTSDVRVWVPGCSTGQEVYSIAMCLMETISKLPLPVPIQVFGTDLSERVLSQARKAVYQENELANVSEERRRRFFVQVDNGYQVVKSVREVCIFARQNVGVDPPFSRLNLISCRNVLIYFGPRLQRQVIATFHYALQPGGYLLLGSSEALSGFPDLFSLVDKQLKFFQKSTLRSTSAQVIARGFAKEKPAAGFALEAASSLTGDKFNVEKDAERIVLSEYAPAWVVVNESFEIIHTKGDTSAFLQLPAGVPSFDLLKMAKDNIRSELRKLLNNAKSIPLRTHSSVFGETGSGEFHRIGLSVRRVSGRDSTESSFLIVFLSPGEREDPAVLSQSRSRLGDRAETELLRGELAFTGHRLQAIIDERDAANHELTSANEKVQSSNEELQSINKQLEAAREELQSNNEELSTLNEELQNRNQELSQAGDDLTNLMSSTTIPILLLDSELRIRRMTPIAEDILGIRPSDVGRPVGEIPMRLSIEDIESLARNVIVTLNPKELALQDREGRWRELRLRPYRTADNRILGVVLVFIDIDELRRAREEATLARRFAESVTQAIRTPLLVLRTDLRIRFANDAFYQDYGLRLVEVEDQPFLELNQKRWDLPGLRDAIEEVLRTGVSHEMEFDGQSGDHGPQDLCIHLRSVGPHGNDLILVALEDLTAQKIASNVLVAKQEQLKASIEAGSAALHETEAALIQSRGELRDLAASLLSAQELERRRISRELHDDLSQKVAKLQFDIETIEQKIPFADIQDERHRLQNLREQTGTLANDLRRVAHGLHPSSLDHLGLTVVLRSYTKEFSRSTGIRVQFTSRKVPRTIPPEVASCFYRIVQEALRNVGKHASEAEVNVRLWGKLNKLDLSIHDNGEGFDMESVRTKGGLGLISMQERVRLVQGTFSLKTQPGRGVQISIEAPLPSEGV